MCYFADPNFGIRFAITVFCIVCIALGTYFWGYAGGYTYRNRQLKGKFYE